MGVKVKLSNFFLNVLISDIVKYFHNIPTTYLCNVFQKPRSVRP